MWIAIADKTNKCVFLLKQDIIIHIFMTSFYDFKDKFIADYLSLK